MVAGPKTGKRPDCPYLVNIQWVTYKFSAISLHILIYFTKLVWVAVSSIKVNTAVDSTPSLFCLLNDISGPYLSVDGAGVGVSTISKDSAAKFTTLPEHYWTVPSNDGGQSIGPACLLKVAGNNIPEWNDHFLIGSLSFGRLMKYNRATDKTFGLNIAGRVRTIRQLPGGDFIALIERSNLTDANGKIIRIKK